MHCDQINLFNGFKELPNTQAAVKKYTYIPTKLYLKHLTLKSRSNQACLDIFKPSLRTILNRVYFTLPTHSFLFFSLCLSRAVNTLYSSSATSFLDEVI